MALATNIDNIRYNGTGRAYAGTVGGSDPGYDLGELENLTFNVAVSTEKLKSTRNAARATILEVETEREGSLSFGLREQSEENLMMVLLGSTVNTLNQTAGGTYQTTKTWVADQFLDMGKLNIFSTKVTGTTTGTLAVGDTVTGDNSSKTGKIAYIGSGFIEIVEVSGSMATDTKLSKDVGNYITIAGIEVLEDPVITSSDGATRRAQGTDYSVDPDAGYIRQLSTGGLLNADKVSFDYEAVNNKYLWGMSAGSVTKRIVFVTDKSDQGPRQRYTFHKVQINLSGDISLIGEKQAVLDCKGSVLADTTQPAGQEYYKVEMM